MTTNIIDESIKLLNSSGINYYSIGKQKDTTIEKAEVLLGVKFPESYKAFLKKLGACSFKDEEIYGLVGENLDSPSIPNVVWCTLNYRKYGLPNNLIVIGHNEHAYPCIKINNDFKKPVIAYDISLPEHVQKTKVLANDFGDYFLEKIKKI